MTSWKSLGRWLGLSLGVLIAAGIFIFVGGWTAYFVEENLPIPLRAYIQSLKTPTADLSVASSAQSAHRSVVAWGLQCVDANSSDDLPTNVRAAYYDTGHSFFPVLSFNRPANAQAKPLKRPPHLNEINAVQLSNMILIQRTDLSRKANEAYSYLQYLQWLAIILGLVTTVVVSISTTELLGKSDSPLGVKLRFFAIFLPALGTAVAAINAFYNPRDEWTRTASTLANIGQLHGQIAIGVWSIECADDATKQKRLSDKLEEWTKRYADVIAIADAGAGPNKQDGAARQGPASQPASQPASAPAPN